MNIYKVELIRFLCVLMVGIPAMFVYRSLLEVNELGFFGYLTACVYALCFIYSHKEKLKGD